MKVLSRSTSRQIHSQAFVYENSPSTRKHSKRANLLGLPEKVCRLIQENYWLISKEHRFCSCYFISNQGVILKCCREYCREDVQRIHTHTQKKIKKIVGSPKKYRLFSLRFLLTNQKTTRAFCKLSRQDTLCLFLRNKRAVNYSLSQFLRWHYSTKKGTSFPG